MGEGGALGEAAVEIRRRWRDDIEEDGGKSFVDVGVDGGTELASRPATPPPPPKPLAALDAGYGLLRRIVIAVTRELMRPGRIKFLREKERERIDVDDLVKPRPTSI